MDISIPLIAATIFVIVGCILAICYIIYLDGQVKYYKKKWYEIQLELKASEAFGHEWHDRAIQAEQELEYYKDPLIYGG